MSEPRDRRQTSGFEIPELELPPLRPQSGMHSVRSDETRVSPAPSPRISAAPEVFPGLGPMLDLGDTDFDAAAIQLDHEAVISQAGALVHYGRSAGLTEDDFAPAVPDALRRSVPGFDLSSNWPSGVTPVRERLILDSNDVRALADYGVPPSFALLAPLYSLRVFFRRRALMVALEAIDRETAAAEAERDARVVALAERLRPALDKDPTSSRLAKGAASSLELGRALLATRGAVDVELATLAAVREADERVRALVSKSELHLRALDVCDEDKVRLGYTCAAILVTAAAALAAWQALT